MRAPTLHEQFADLDKQAHAARLGMWLFLGSESMLFTGLFALYAAYRVMYPTEMAAAVAHQNLAIGTVNLVVLLTASLLAVLGEQRLASGAPRRAAGLFAGAGGLGVVFLILKGVEYAQHFREGILPGAGYRFAALPGRGARMFFTLYYQLTGLHALHLFAGVVVLAWLSVGCLRGSYSAARKTPVVLGVLYFHVVDLFWIFLWPLLYLARE